MIEHVNYDFFLKLDLRPSKTRFSLLLINLLDQFSVRLKPPFYASIVQGQVKEIKIEKGG